MVWLQPNASAALRDSVVSEKTIGTGHGLGETVTSEEDACEQGLTFGMTPDKIPAVCRAYPLAISLATARRREKWHYRAGYLLFYDGVLTAIIRRNLAH
jgi:hypothetical protein